MNPTRPILRYHGGKWRLAQWIIGHFPVHRVYVEPYGGGASVLLQKPRSYAEVYNDLDGEVVNVFRVARDQGQQLREALYFTPFSRDEFMAAYEPSDDPVDQARRTIIRSFMGHGSNSHAYKSGFRANANRAGTTPARDWMNYPDAFDAIISRLRGVIIENRDAREIMATHDAKQTLHYVDPPYISSTRSGCKGYQHEMTDSDHIHLAAFLRTLKGFVILSGYRCDLYDDLFSGWHREDRLALADGAAERTESLWFSPNTPAHNLFTYGKN